MPHSALRACSTRAGLIGACPSENSSGDLSASTGSSWASAHGLKATRWSWSRRSALRLMPWVDPGKRMEWPSNHSRRARAAAPDLTALKYHETGKRFLAKLQRGRGRPYPADLVV